MVSHMTPRRLPPLICVLQEKTVNKRAGRGDFLWTELSLKWSYTVLWFLRTLREQSVLDTGGKKTAVFKNKNEPCNLIWIQLKSHLSWFLQKLLWAFSASHIFSNNKTKGNTHFHSAQDYINSEGVVSSATSHFLRNRRTTNFIKCVSFWTERQLLCYI